MKLWTAILAAGIAWSAESDALRIEERIQQRHLPFSAIMNPVYASPESGEIASYSRCGDSAIWTGHYLAAEAYRYAVTKSPEALEQVRVALTGITVLFLVTGRDIPARCAFRDDFAAAADIVSEERANRAYPTEFFGERWTWIGNTSRDQYLGIYFGLTAAWDLVDDAGVRDTIRWLVGFSLGKLLDDRWSVRMPDGSSSTTFAARSDQQLTMLKLGARTDPERFGAEYREQAASQANGVFLPIAFDTLDPHSSYFKFNLAHITFFGLLASGGDTASARSGYRNAWTILRRTTDDHQNAFFDMIARAVDGPDANRDKNAAKLLDEWLQRPERDTWVDLRAEVRTCGDRACDPVPVARRVPTDFVWQRSPFQILGGGYGKIETAGVDYILPYWMARYYGVVSD